MAPQRQNQRNTTAGGDVHAFRQRALLALSKLNDPDTQRNAMEDSKDLLDDLDPTTLPVFLTALGEVSDHQRPMARRESLKILASLCEANPDLLLLGLPKILTLICKRLRDGDSHVQDACADCMARMTAVLLPLAETQQNGSIYLSTMLKPLFQLMGQPARALQIGAACCVVQVLQSAPSQCVRVLCPRLCPRLLELLASPGCLAAPQVLRAIDALITAVGNEILGYLSEVVPALLSCASTSSVRDWPVRKACVDTLVSLAQQIRRPHLSPYVAAILEFLQLLRHDKFKPVRDSTIEAIQVYRLMAADLTETHPHAPIASSFEPAHHESIHDSPSHLVNGADLLYDESLDRVESRVKSARARRSMVPPSVLRLTPASAVATSPDLPNGKSHPMRPVSPAQPRPAVSIFEKPINENFFQSNSTKGATVILTPPNRSSARTQSDLSAVHERDGYGEVSQSVQPQQLQHIQTELRSLRQGQVTLINDLSEWKASTSQHLSSLEQLVMNLQQRLERLEGVCQTPSHTTAYQTAPRSNQLGSNASQRQTPANVTVKRSSPVRPLDDNEPSSPTHAADSMLHASADPWAVVLRLLQLQRLVEAFKIVVSNGDELHLIRLMGRTGPCFNKLSGDSDVTAAVLVRLIHLLHTRNFVDTILPWLLQALQLHIAIPTGDASDEKLIIALRQLSGQPNAQGMEAAKVYTLALRQQNPKL
eukprot:GILK01011513.1.p1 GENE.GILK01011513.1~~GILK01011513.1.p1  ORF type:complete len:708 (+),score=79.16 GILK01011513.1:73-2196(+)